MIKIVDGYLKIKTKIDNSDVPKDIQDLENKINKAQNENSEKSQEQKNLENEINLYKKLQQQADTYRQKIKELKAEKQAMLSQNANLVTGNNTAEYAAIESELKLINDKYIQATAQIDKQAPRIERLYTKLNKVKAKQTENNAKITEYKTKIESIKTQNIENSVSNIGKGITKQISQIGRMAVGIAGIYTAWGAVRSAISLVSQYDSQISANLEYMKFVLANAIAPLIQNLISLAMTLLSYINAIATAWFGINLFGNSSVENFQKMQKSATSTAKASKEIQKTLQGFDEMNVLQDNSGSETENSGGSTGAIPSMDLSSMQAPIPEWLQWIIDNKDLMLQVISGIVAGILAIKLGLDGITALGIGVLIAGIVGLVQSIIAYLNDPSWTNFGNIITNIGIAIVGLALIIGNVPLAIAGAIATIIGLIVSNWESIKSFLQGGIDWLFEQTDWVKENFRNIRGICLQYIY